MQLASQAQLIAAGRKVREYKATCERYDITPEDADRVLREALECELMAPLPEMPRDDPFTSRHYEQYSSWKD